MAAGEPSRIQPARGWQPRSRAASPSRSRAGTGGHGIGGSATTNALNALPGGGAPNTGHRPAIVTGGPKSASLAPHWLQCVGGRIERISVAGPKHATLQPRGHEHNRKHRVVHATRTAAHIKPTTGIGLPPSAGHQPAWALMARQKPRGPSRGSGEWRHIVHAAGLHANRRASARPRARFSETTGKAIECYTLVSISMKSPQWIQLLDCTD